MFPEASPMGFGIRSQRCSPGGPKQNVNPCLAFSLKHCSPLGNRACGGVRLALGTEAEVPQHVCGQRVGFGLLRPKKQPSGQQDTCVHGPRYPRSEARRTQV